MLLYKTHSLSQNMDIRGRTGEDIKVGPLTGKIMIFMCADHELSEQGDRGHRGSSWNEGHMCQIICMSYK